MDNVCDVIADLVLTYALTRLVAIKRHPTQAGIDEIFSLVAPWRPTSWPTNLTGEFTQAIMDELLYLEEVALAQDGEDEFYQMIREMEDEDTFQARQNEASI